MACYAFPRVYQPFEQTSCQVAVTKADVRVATSEVNSLVESEVLATSKGILHIRHTHHSRGAVQCIHTSIDGVRSVSCCVSVLCLNGNLKESSGHNAALWYLPRVHRHMLD